MKIIGLTGEIGSGKDEVSKIFYKQGAVVLSFKKHFVTCLIKALGLEVYLNEMLVLFEDRTLKDDPNPLLYNKTPRHLMESFGDWSRNSVSKNIWVDLVEEEIMSAQVRYGDRATIIIKDVRFENEAMLVAKHKGEVWRIVRTYNPFTQSNHISNLILPNKYIDKILMNEGDIDTLERNIEELK